MKKTLLTLVALLLFSSKLMAAYPVTEQDMAFFISLQYLVQKGEKEKLGALIKYPLKVSMPSEDIVVSGSQDFVSRYDDVFSPAVVAAILKQNPEKLFKNWQGVMIGSGEVWFGEIKLTEEQKKYRYFILGINNRK